MFGDGTKNAEFSSPDAVYVTAANWISDEEPSTVGGTVPATLALTLGAPASFGPFTPGVAKDYFATTTATVTSTAGDATLTVADPSTNGHRPPGQRRLLAPAAAAGLGRDRRHLRAGRRLLRADHAEGLERPDVQRLVHRQLQADDR